MTNRCVRCWTDFEANFRGNVCGSCSTVVPGFPSYKPGICEYRVLNKGTKDETRMSKAEQREIESGVAVPVGKSFAYGRYERGKIREKAPRGE